MAEGLKGGPSCIMEGEDHSRDWGKGDDGGGGVICLGWCGGWGGF